MLVKYFVKLHYYTYIGIFFFFFLKATASSLKQFNLWPIILASYFIDSTYKIIL